MRMAHPKSIPSFMRVEVPSFPNPKKTFTKSPLPIIERYFIAPVKRIPHEVSF